MKEKNGTTVLDDRSKWQKLKFEYWPWQLIYLPVFFKYLAYSILERNLFWFYATNPGIETGGLMIESKYGILEKVPEIYRPKMQLCRLNNVHVDHYPIIIKPNYGARGISVEKINNKGELDNYIRNHPHEMEYIVQEYIDLPCEVGIFYYYDPLKQKGTISSVTLKEFLSVKGDGQSSIAELMMEDFRSQEHIKRLSQKIDIDRVPEADEIVELEPIGNHNRGTTFLNGNHLINEKLTEVFSELAQEIEGFYYGRFDIRAASFEDIYEGKFKILELNGAKSEPTHIYHPNYPVSKAYKCIFHHWRVMRNLARHNRNNGHIYPNHQDGFRDYKRFKYYRKGIS